MPSNTQFHFAAISKITMEHSAGIPSSVLRSTDLRLEVSGNLDKSRYLDDQGLPKEISLMPISIALITGLIVNVRMGAEKGWWKEGEHMEFVFSELKRVFVAQASTPHISSMEY